MAVPPLAWYPISALRRPDVRVRIAGPGYVCVGWRGAGRHVAFFALSGKGKGRRLPAEHAPTAFQPLDPAQPWPDPLPDPIIAAGEADWRSPAPEPVRDPYGCDHGPIRWDDPHTIPYNARGEVLRDEAEARLLRALKTMATWRVLDTDISGSRVAWPAVIREWGDYTGHAEADGRFVARDRTPSGARIEVVPAPPRFEPTPRDQDDALIALAWYAALHPPEARHRHETWALSLAQRIVAKRAADPPWSFRRIGEDAGRSHAWAADTYADTIDTIWGIANDTNSTSLKSELEELGLISGPR